MMRGNRTTTIVSVAFGALVLTAGLAMAGATPEQKCEASKNKAVGAYYLCREKAEAAAIAKGLSADYSKCTATFDVKWDGAETKGGGMCPDTVLTAPMNAFVAAQAAEAALVVAGGPIPDCAGDLATCEGDLAACEAGGGGGGLPATGQTTAFGAGSDGDVQAGVPRTFTDNGDGTITDHATGLMWEKKDQSGGIHDWNNVYTWSMGAGMDGTIVTTFLAALNGGGGFAGYTDWRVPNRFELESLLNLEVTYPATYSAFNTDCTPTCTVLECSCTQSIGYWSSSAAQPNPTHAWFADFAVGITNGAPLPSALEVRAVRGAS